MSEILVEVLNRLGHLSIDELETLKRSIEFRLMSPEERAEAAATAFDQLDALLRSEGNLTDAVLEQLADLTINDKPQGR
jgi:hypothetical protein